MPDLNTKTDAPGGQPFVPPRRGVVVWLCIAALAVTLGVTVVLVAHLRHAKTLDAAEYEPYTLGGFNFTCAAELRHGNMLVLEGYAVETSDYLVEVNNFVVLLNRQTGVYLRLPTIKVRSIEAEEDHPGYNRYGQSGYHSFVYLSQLATGPENYELCFAYRSNQSNWLIRTGVLLSEVGVEAW